MGFLFVWGSDFFCKNPLHEKLLDLLVYGTRKFQQDPVEVIGEVWGRKGQTGRRNGYETFF